MSYKAILDIMSLDLDKDELKRRVKEVAKDLSVKEQLEICSHLLDKINEVVEQWTIILEDELGIEDIQIT